MKTSKKNQKKEQVDVQACLDRASEKIARVLGEMEIFQDKAEGKSKPKKKPRGKSGRGLSDKK